MKIIKENKDEPAATLIVKIKFFAQGEPEEGEDQMYRVKFTKKKGNLIDWYDLFDEMKEEGTVESMSETANN